MLEGCSLRGLEGLTTWVPSTGKTYITKAKPHRFHEAEINAGWHKAVEEGLMFIERTIILFGCILVSQVTTENSFAERAISARRLID